MLPNPLASLVQRGAACGLVVFGLVAVATAQSGPGAAGRTPKAVYDAACAHCHGRDGRGGTPERLSLPVPTPDFSDCQFAPREPDSDWAAVIHDGGPARAFHRFMPAFGDALSAGDISLALQHVRSFCADPSWPRGELNLPKALATEKAFPEDELIVTTTIGAEGDGAVKNKFVYEKRFGARNQIELVVPIQSHATAGNWTGGVGDVAVAFKRVLAASHTKGAIMSVTGELVMPTGATDTGLGEGHAVFEPFVTFGKILPADSFVQFQGGGAFPMRDGAPRESFYRFVAGKTWTQGRSGRAWSPMVELLGAKAHESGQKVQWDILPELQVSLSTRQHILMNVGVRIPLTDSGPRKTQVLMYLLWDWFDGGFFQGW